MPELTEPAPITETSAPPAQVDYPALQAVRDLEYIRDCEAAGMEPLPNYKKQLSVNVVIPGVILDRGHRVGDPATLEQTVAPTHTVEVVDQVLAEDCELERRRRAALETLAIFIGDSKDALQAGTRLAAWIMRTGDIGPTEMKRRWPDLTETPLRNARKHLDELLSQEEGGAK